MDRNSVIGLVLIGAILIVYNIFTTPSAEEIQKQKALQDSIARVEQVRIDAETKAAELYDTEAEVPAELAVVQDSLLMAQNQKRYGLISNAAQGEEKITYIENDLFKLGFSNKGGRIVSSELKNFQAWDSSQIQLFEEQTAEFYLNFFLINQLEVNSNSLFFSSQDKSFQLSGDKTRELRYKLSTNDGSGELNIIYRFKGNSYAFDFDVETRNFPVSPSKPILLNWKINGLSQEKSRQLEMQKASVFFKYLDRDRDYLSETSADDLEAERKLNWVSFKQNFFSAFIISDKGFIPDNSTLAIEPLENEEWTKFYAAQLQLPFDNPGNDRVDMEMYMGPNKHAILNGMGRDLDRIIDLGWGIFGWVNKYLVLPIFNFLGGLNWNYGLIILVLTIIIKSLLIPFTYKNYKSSAKMRVLKPEIDKLNEKHKKSDPMAKQQAMMALYRETGVNPMAGCLPMLLQMPILYAMFRFFPSSIELRGQSFLWADDLSSYDSIYDLPFSIPVYGDHISLFTLLMCASTLVYTRMNSTNMPQQQQGMPNMKIIMYIFPFMMLFFFNNFSSGLSFYYFLANMITMGQMFVIKKYIIDEKKILAKIEAKKKGPTKKSRFQRKMEEMANKKGINLPKK